MSNLQASIVALSNTYGQHGVTKAILDAVGHVAKANGVPVGDIQSTITVDPWGEMADQVAAILAK